METLIVRLVLIWIFLGQMIFVCMPASTTRSLSRLESTYAFKPSAENKAALENEFNRVADYESQRAIVRFAILLAIDVAVIAFCWNLGDRIKAPTKRINLASLFVGEPRLN